LNIENLKTLKIHKLSQEQYDRELLAGNLDPNAFYLTPDDGDADSITIDLENVNVGAPNGINADTLGGRAASEFALASDLENLRDLVENSGGGSNEAVSAQINDLNNAVMGLQIDLIASELRMKSEVDVLRQEILGGEW
jgi:hypothetical protein